MKIKIRVTSIIQNSHPIHNKIQISIHNTTTNNHFKTIKNRIGNIIDIINKKKKKKIWICKTTKNKTMKIENKMSMTTKNSRRKVHRMKMKSWIYRIRIITFTKSIVDFTMQTLYSLIDCNSFWMRSRI